MDETEHNIDWSNLEAALIGVLVIVAIGCVALFWPKGPKERKRRRK